MDKQETRLNNLKIIERKISRKRLSRLTGIDYGYLNFMFTKRRSISNEKAAQIEKALSLDAGWMDEFHEQPKEGIDSFNIMKNFSIPLLDIEACAGSGTFAISENIIGSFDMSKKLLDERNIQADKSFMVKVRNNCMHPYISNGDYVIVDTSKNTLQNASVYAIRLDDTLMIKRLCREKAAITITCDNEIEKKRFPDVLIEDSEESRLRIIGKVMIVNKMSDV